LLPLQDKIRLFCFLYAFEITGNLYRQQEGSNKIEYILVSSRHTKETLLCKSVSFVCVSISTHTGAYRVKTDQTSIWRI